MQGKILLSLAALSCWSGGALAADVKRPPCPKAEQQGQRPQQSQQQAQQRSKAQGCPVPRAIPPAVDPTPIFLL